MFWQRWLKKLTGSRRPAGRPTHAGVRRTVHLHNNAITVAPVAYSRVYNIREFALFQHSTGVQTFIALPNLSHYALDIGDAYLHFGLDAAGNVTSENSSAAEG